MLDSAAYDLRRYHRGSGHSFGVWVALSGALLRGLVFNILNFENGRGVISLSACWQMVIRGGFLFAVILLHSRLAGQTKGATR